MKIKWSTDHTTYRVVYLVDGAIEEIKRRDELEITVGDIRRGK